MSLTIDELSPKFVLTTETCHATPARRHHTGLSAVRTTVFRARLALCPALAPGCDAGPRGAHRDSRLAGDGAGQRGPLHALPSGLEPGHVVSPSRESDALRVADRAPGAPGSDDRVWRGRHSGTPFGTEDRGQGLLSRCAAFDQDTRHPLLWLEVGVGDALSPGALEPAGVGVAVSDRPVLARRAGRPAPARPVWTGCDR